MSVVSSTCWDLFSSSVASDTPAGRPAPVCAHSIAVQSLHSLPYKFVLVIGML